MRRSSSGSWHSKELHMHRRSVGLIALLGICATSLFVGVLASSGGQSQIVYDDEHGAIVITAPQGWTFEHKASPEEGVRAVVHPIGMTAPKASSVMYLRTVPKNSELNLEVFIRADAQRRATLAPGARIVAGESLRTARDEHAPLRHLSTAADFESVVYLEAPAVYVTITLTSKTKAAHETSQGALAELVKSYHVSTVTGAVRR
jgi:hypothetical protein